ncbi:hypothetical protein OAK19_00780 [Aureispira]|nr:hypothetical protein [Aureispira sp.]
MDTYKILTIIHIIFALSAFVSGLVSIVVNPKGGSLHRKSGRFYFYFYVGVIFTALVMLTIKFKIFFLALTLFNAYLIISGIYYSKKNEKIIGKNWWLLSFLILVILVFMSDVSLVISNIEYYEYGWIIVSFSYAILAVSVFIFELTVKRNRFLLHAVTMLLSYITLINGILAQLSPIGNVWIFWIAGYIIFIPLMILWFKKSKKLQLLLKTQ